MGDLGFRQASGVLSTDGTNPYGNGFWVVAFTPAVLAVPTGTFEVYHLALTGPLGSQVKVYVDRTFYDVTNHGDVNSWDPQHTLHLIGGGQTVNLYWNTGNTPVPQVTLWLQESSII